MTEQSKGLPLTTYGQSVRVLGLVSAGHALSNSQTTARNAEVGCGAGASALYPSITWFPAPTLLKASVAAISRQPRFAGSRVALASSKRAAR